jgi:leader peptidase (prepilin peptidase)/N-methyltransferase
MIVMEIWIISPVFAAATLLLGYAMVEFTDRRCEDGNKYREGRFWPVLPSLAAVLGGLLAYLVFDGSSYIFARVALMLAYMSAVMAGICDYKLKLIPNMIPLALAAARALMFIAEAIVWEAPTALIISSLTGGLLCTLLLLIAMKLTKGGIGYGDIKLMGALGFCVGYRAVFSILMTALFACALFAVPMVALKKKKLAGEMPFAPFICVGCAVTLALALY